MLLRIIVGLTSDLLKFVKNKSTSISIHPQKYCAISIVTTQIEDLNSSLSSANVSIQDLQSTMEFLQVEHSFIEADVVSSFYFSAVNSI